MVANQIPVVEIKAIVGLGNPGPAYCKTRHNIGFLILNQLADEHQGFWQTKNNMEVCSIIIDEKKLLLVKPMTFMNDSGKILPALAKQGIKQDNLLIVHDELELPFGIIKFKFDGSAKGHNGLKSIMALGGSNFLRLRFGIDRPGDRQDVPDYVLTKFKEPQDLLDQKIHEATTEIVNLILKQ